MKLFKHLLSFIPTRLPVGLTEFHAWADDIISISGKFADEDSMKFALASMIQHSGSSKGLIAKRFFVNSLRKAAANQVAAQVFQDIKTKQAEAVAEAAKLEAAAKAELAKVETAVTSTVAEVTASVESVTNAIQKTI